MEAQKTTAPSSGWVTTTKPNASRTLQFAVASLDTGTGRVETNGAVWSSTSTRPQTHVEQYWAARALTAETVLSAHTSHQRELSEVKHREEARRQREIEAVVHVNEIRQHKLEKFVAALVAVLVGLFCFVTYMMYASMKVSTSRNKGMHFTIPILSPFTSVVEHETGVIGTRAVTIFILVLGIVAYASIRRWMRRT